MKERLATHPKNVINVILVGPSGGGIAAELLPRVAEFHLVQLCKEGRGWVQGSLASTPNLGEVGSHSDGTESPFEVLLFLKLVLATARIIKCIYTDTDSDLNRLTAQNKSVPWLIVL